MGFSRRFARYYEHKIQRFVISSVPRAPEIRDLLFEAFAGRCTTKDFFVISPLGSPLYGNA